MSMRDIEFLLLLMPIMNGKGVKLLSVKHNNKQIRLIITLYYAHSIVEIEEVNGNENR